MMATHSRTQIRGWFVEATQKQDIDLRRFGILVINADDAMWKRIQFAAVKVMNDPVYKQDVILYSQQNIVRLKSVEQDTNLLSMREFYRKAKDKGNVHLQRFATLYLNADNHMFNYIVVAAYFIMKDNETDILEDLSAPKKKQAEHVDKKSGEIKTEDIAVPTIKKRIIDKLSEIMKIDEGLKKDKLI
jgi:hypothetical protein